MVGNAACELNRVSDLIIERGVFLGDEGRVDDTALVGSGVENLLSAIVCYNEIGVGIIAGHDAIYLVEKVYGESGSESSVSKDVGE